MITYNGNILTTSTGKWYIPNRPYSISYSTVPNGSFSGPSQAYGGELVTVTATPGSNYMLDYITVNGIAIQGNTFIMPYGEVVISGAFKINYNPLNLPPFTIRLLYKDGVTPTFEKGTGVQVSQNPNIWDLTYNNTRWTSVLMNHTDLLEVLGANVSGVRNMLSMFSGCSSLTTVQLFDTSSVTNMNFMFANCSSLTTVPLFDTSNVITMEWMFYNCSYLTTVPLFDTHNVTSMNYMFYNAYSLTTVPLFDTSNVTNMKWMFTSTSLASVPLFDTSSVTDMDLMFFGCQLTSVPLFDTSNVTNMRQMFYGCPLTTVPLFDTSSVTNMSQMFYGCSSLTSVPLFDTSNVTNMYEMFIFCSSLTTVPLFDTSKVTNVYGMFAHCINVESGALALYNQMSTQTTPPTDHQHTFEDCGRDTVTGAAELAQIPSDWK